MISRFCSRWILLVGMLLLIACDLQQVKAVPVPAYTLNTAPEFASDPTGYTIGFRFTLSNDVNVTHLGFWDDNRFNGTHDVGIYADGNTTVLVQAPVVVSTLAMDTTNYVYTQLGTPYLLAAGTYRIGAYNNGANFNRNSVPTEAAGFDYLEGRYNTGGSLAYPDSTNSPYYNLANFQFEAVPEPATIGLAAVGLVAVAGVARRRARRRAER